MISRNFKETVKQFIASDETFRFMSAIEGTLAYRKIFLHEVLTIFKQFGLPTFCLTLSCTDLRWNELVSIISKLDSASLNEEDIQKMSYQESSAK